MNGIKLDNLGYFPIPKAACTSIKLKLFELSKKSVFTKGFEGHDHVHLYWEKNKKSIDSCSERVIVVRDPIKRFLSAYTNRVNHHCELSLTSIKKSNPKIASSFNIYNPGLGQFIDDFESYVKVNSIKHHTQKVSNLINNDLSYFSKVYPIENIASFEKELSKIRNENVSFPREQVGGRKIPISDLNKDQVDFLMEYYREDYFLLKKYYSFDKFWNEWKQGV